MINRDIRVLTNRYGRAAVWYAATFLCLCLEWWLIKWNLKIEYPNAFGTLLKAAGDIALILLPYWMLAPKWRWTALLPVWGFSLWGVCNIAYCRFWDDLIPAAAVTMGGNVDGNLMEYGISLLHWSDILFLIIPLIAWAFYYFTKPSKSASFSYRKKILLISISIIAGLTGQFSYFKSIYNWRYSYYGLSIKDAIHEHYFGVNNSQKIFYSSRGPVNYCARFIADIFEVLSSSVELTAEQREEIGRFLENYERRRDKNGTNADSDSLNVVYIIVESLNSKMLNKDIGGMEIMPFLDSLATAEGTVLFDNVVSQTKVSSSSDGHLLLMTGLLPPDKISYSITYGSKNRFPSIADVLPHHHKYLLLADDGVCWNEGNTLRNFGLGEPLVVKDRKQYSIKEYARDGAMFKQATEMLDTIRQPFFMTLMTISMHIPFKEEAWPVADAIENAEGLSRMEKDYANMCHNLDNCLKEFVGALPENTLLFIASDHSQSLATEEGEQTTGIFMAVNSGRTEKISRTVGQVNIFPATLDILGRNTGYGGLAQSAFDPSVDGTIDSYGNVYGNPSPAVLDTLRRAYEISDLIIRSDYFGN